LKAELADIADTLGGEPDDADRTEAPEEDGGDSSPS
jgi:hypothetical protein